ncbi:hypothetical protein AMJ80_07415 [bacterium SM23_31]|nr:MAG: hypothetical protein AMJ80_07415 [bacterium SM23_31]
MILPVILLVVLLFFSAFFSGAEIAFMSLSDLKVRHLIEQNKRNSRLLRKLKSKPNKLLITVLIGNNLANVGASALATMVSIGILSDLDLGDTLGYSVGITTGVMTLLILIFGEISPKSYCIHHAEQVALNIAPIIRTFQWIFSPVAWFLNVLTRATAGDFFSKRYPLVTEEEVRTIVKIGEEEGVIKQEEKEMIHNVFEMDNTDVASVMTPRLDMFALDESLTINDAIKEIEDVAFSRIPAYEQSIDKIVGIVYRKDILHAGLRNEGNNPLSSIIQPAIFVPENMMIDALLREFKKQKNHLALVVDEHGGIAGLVTFEDVLEELIGEIYDETDELEQPVVQVDENTFKVSAKLNINEINEMLDLDLEEDDSYDTLSGLILLHLGHIPEKGENIEIDNLSLTVNKVEEHRITEVIIKKRKPGEQPQESE